MQSKLPLVSVAVCTYNGERHLTEQLESLVNQTYPNLEIIVADDHSTDGTIGILQAFREKYPFFNYVVNDQNLGYVKNFEKVISLCKGAFIALCDQDDIWRSDKTALMAEQIGENALIYHDSELISNDGLSLNTSVSAMYNMYEGDQPYPFFFLNNISGHAMLFNSALRSAFLPFDKKYYHDWSIAIMAAENGGIKYIPEKLVRYRQHNNSTTDILNLKSAPLPGAKSIFNAESLGWIAYFGSRTNVHKTFVEEMLSCFDKDYKVIKSIKLFVLMLSKYKLMFYRSRKSSLSKLNLIRRACF